MATRGIPTTHPDPPHSLAASVQRACAILIRNAANEAIAAWSSVAESAAGLR